MTSNKSIDFSYKKINNKNIYNKLDLNYLNLYPFPRELDILYNYNLLQIKDIDFFKGRWGHTSIVYNNKIYIFGGFDGNNYLNDLIEFDISSMKIKSIMYSNKNFIDIPSPRSNHTACLYDSNKLLIFGGNGLDSLYADTYILNLDDFNWTLIDELGPIVGSYHTGNLLNNNYLVLFGGLIQNEVTNKLYVLDISLNSWFEININRNLLKSRHFHMSGCNSSSSLDCNNIYKDKIIVFSGANNNDFENCIADLIEIDFERIFNKNINNNNKTNNKILEFNNSNIKINRFNYDNCLSDELIFDKEVKSNTRELLDNFPLPRWGGNLLSYKNKAYILIGGRDSYFKINLSDIWLLIKSKVDLKYYWFEVKLSNKNNIDSNKEFIPSRKFSTCLVESNLYIIGGYDNLNFINSIYVLNLQYIDEFITIFNKYNNAAIISNNKNLDTIYNYKYLNNICNKRFKLYDGYIKIENVKINVKEHLDLLNKEINDIYLYVYENFNPLIKDEQSLCDSNIECNLLYIKKIYNLIILNNNTVFLTSKFVFLKNIPHNDLIKSFINKLYKEEDKDLSIKYKCIDFTSFKLQNTLIHLFIELLCTGQMPLNLTFYDLFKICKMLEKLKFYEMTKVLTQNIIVKVSELDKEHDFIDKKYSLNCNSNLENFSNSNFMYFCKHNCNYFINKYYLNLNCNLIQNKNYFNSCNFSNTYLAIISKSIIYGVVKYDLDVEIRYIIEYIITNDLIYKDSLILFINNQFEKQYNSYDFSVYNKNYVCFIINILKASDNIILKKLNLKICNYLIDMLDRHNQEYSCLISYSFYKFSFFDYYEYFIIHIILLCSNQLNDIITRFLDYVYYLTQYIVNNNSNKLNELECIYKLLYKLLRNNKIYILSFKHKYNNFNIESNKDNLNAIFNHISKISKYIESNLNSNLFNINELKNKLLLIKNEIVDILNNLA